MQANVLLTAAASGVGASGTIADDAPTLHVVLHPGKFLTAAIISCTHSDQKDAKDPTAATALKAELLWYAYERSAFFMGMPPLEAACRFVRLIIGNFRRFSKKYKTGPTLVCTPPPAQLIAARNPDFLQQNTWFEAYVVGGLEHGLTTYSTYVNPAAVASEMLPPGAVYEGLDERVQGTPSAQLVVSAAAERLTGHPIRHEKTAWCVLTAVYYYWCTIAQDISDVASPPLQQMPPPCTSEAAAENAQIAHEAQVATPIVAIAEVVRTQTAQPPLPPRPVERSVPTLRGAWARGPPHGGK